jgi:hypothetical protein
MTQRFTFHDRKAFFMKHSLCIAFAFFVLIGYVQVADTPFALQLQAQDTIDSTDTAAAPKDGEKTDGEKAETPKERDPVQLTKVTVVLEGEDVLKQEGIHEWAAKAAQLVVEYYPIFDKKFESEGFVPKKEITLIFRKMDGVAFSSGTSITISADWIKRSPGDFGMVAHEMTHVIQQYPGGRGEGGIPTWLMEGMTDYARHVFYEPDVLMRPTNPDRDNYTGSYQITGGFLMWIEHAYDKEFVSKLNKHARQRTYSDDLFEKYTGKNAETLWKEYGDFLRTLEGNRILPSREFGRKRLGATYSVAPPQPQPGQGQGRQRPQPEN